MLTQYGEEETLYTIKESTTKNPTNVAQQRRHLEKTCYHEYYHLVVGVCFFTVVNFRDFVCKRCREVFFMNVPYSGLR